jgi:hypothetical protein
MSPPAPPVYRVAEIQMKGIVASAGSSSHASDLVFHFRRTATVNPWIPTAIDTAFQAAIAAAIAAALNNRYTQSMNTIRCVDDAYNAETFVSHAAVGAIAGDSMAMHNSAYMLCKTGFRGGSYRGNKKFFPLSESDSTAATADLLNAAALVRFGTIATALLAGFTDANGNIFEFGVLSRLTSVLKTNPTTVNWTKVTSIAMNQRIGRVKKREAVSVY